MEFCVYYKIINIIHIHIHIHIIVVDMMDDKIVKRTGVEYIQYFGLGLYSLCFVMSGVNTN